MEKIIKKEVGRRISILLAYNNKSSKELANELNVSLDTISRFIEGTKSPNLVQIVKIAKFFDIEINQLICTDANQSIYIYENQCLENVKKDLSQRLDGLKRRIIESQSDTSNS
jgi:transcriptional regulator with XRE-family HTH domain